MYKTPGAGTHGKPQFAGDDIVLSYIEEHSLRLHPAQKKLIELTTSLTGEDTVMLGAADELQLLANLVKTINGKNTLDIGTFTGYSALTIALALPNDGKVVSCDVTDEWANLGRDAWKEAGVEDKIDLRIQSAVEVLETLIADGEEGAYDFAFIDADKENYSSYYDLCKRLVRSGGMIAVDNVLWDGKAPDPKFTDSETEAIRDVNRKIRDDKSVDISMLRIADGVTIVFKR